MAWQSIPDDQPSDGNVSHRWLKLDDLGAADGAGKEPEVIVPLGHPPPSPSASSSRSDIAALESFRMASRCGNDGAAGSARFRR